MSRTTYFAERARNDYELAKILAGLYGVSRAQIELWEAQYLATHATN